MSFLLLGVLSAVCMAGEISSPQLVDELKGELTVIIGQCDMLEDAFSTQPHSLAHIKTIKTVALRMADRISSQPWPDVKVLQRQKRTGHSH
jgi:hypothetical protein